MSLFNVFTIAGSAMNADSVLLNTTSSNLANANAASSSSGQTYKARYPVFGAEFNRVMSKQGQGVPVKVLAIVESDKPLRMEYNPDHPMANEQGYIFKPNVNVMEEMANMIIASRSYQTNVEVAQATKQMLMRTLQMGQ